MVVSAPVSFLQAAVFCAFLLGLLALPFALLRVGYAADRRNPSMTAKRIMGFGAGIGIVYVALAVSFVVWAGPGKSGVVIHGHTPDGREYCIVQTYSQLMEPYQVSFYVRDDEGRWRWNYLAHEDPAWRSAEVVFTDSAAIVSRNGQHHREIPLPTAREQYETTRPKYLEENDLPAKSSIGDIVDFHNNKFGSR